MDFIDELEKAREKFRNKVVCEDGDLMLEDEAAFEDLRGTLREAASEMLRLTGDYLALLHEPPRTRSRAIEEIEADQQRAHPDEITDLAEAIVRVNFTAERYEMSQQTRAEDQELCNEGNG